MNHKTEIRCFKRYLALTEKQVEGGETQAESGESGENAPVTSVGYTSSQWTPEEDELLKAKVTQFGTQNWVIIARFLTGRLGRQCRERWHNVLDPTIVRRDWTEEEDIFII